MSKQDGWEQVRRLPIHHDFFIEADGKIASRQEMVLPLTWFPAEFTVEPSHVTALGPFYFRRLAALSHGLIRVETTGPAIRFLLAWLRWPLLCFAPPVYHIEPAGGEAVYRLVGGRALLSPAPLGGALRLGLRQTATALHVWMEIRDYYAWLVGQGRIWLPRRLLYQYTQAALHHLIARDFVRHAGHALHHGSLDIA